MVLFLAGGRRVFRLPLGFHGRPLLCLSLKGSITGRVAQRAAASAQTRASGLKFAHFVGVDLLEQRFRRRAFAGLEVRFRAESFQAAAGVMFAALAAPMMLFP